MGTRSFFPDSDIQSDSELSTLMAEITSLERERKDLIGSLTPGISRWVDEISGTATSSVRDKVDCNEPFGILEDIEGLGDRMLSMSHFLSSSNSHIPLYKADELVSISSKLMKISKDFYKSTELAIEKVTVEAAEAGEKRTEEERKEEKKKRERMRKKEKEKKKKKQQQQKEKDEEDKKKRGMMRKKEKEKKKKKKEQQQQQHKEEDAQVTSEKITEKMERKEEEEEEAEETRRQQEVRKIMTAHEFLRLSSNVLARPNLYRNELAMVITEEDEQEYERVREAKMQAKMEAEEAKREAERKAQREREQQRERSKQRKAEREAKRKQMPQKEPIVEEEEHADEQEAKSPKEQLKERMDNQLGFFADYRTAWEYSSGSKAGLCGGFKDKTTLSPMQFTHCIPGIIPPRAAVIESTLQIYSFKITGLSDDLKWPLNVYGVVAARDTVDHNRNLLFSRSSIMRQVLTSENDCSLCLTGPSRAILAMDPVDFEVELRVHDGYDYRGDEVNDRELICVSSRYEVATSGELPLAPSSELPCLTFHSPLCTAKLSLERLPSTIQATILSVRVVGGGSPFKSGVQVSCLPCSADGSAAMHEVVLLDSLEGIPQEYDELDLDGYLPLSRNVVSVECGGGLDVVVKAYGGSGSTSTHIYFPSGYCNISQRTCSVCGSQVDITVAWSRLVRDKMDLLIDGYTTQA